MNDRPFLLTDRFELWRPAASDLAGLCNLMADDETRRFLGPARADPSSQFERLMRNAGSWALYGYGTFLVREKGGNGGIIASCGVFHSYRGFEAELEMEDVPEAGWIVHRAHCGQGLAREVMEAVLAWFDAAHGPRRIACMIEDGNMASRRLAARLGFRQYTDHTIEEGDDHILLRLYRRG